MSSIQGQFAGRKAALSTFEGVVLGSFTWVGREFHGVGC